MSNVTEKLNKTCYTLILKYYKCLFESAGERLVTCLLKEEQTLYLLYFPAYFFLS